MSDFLSSWHSRLIVGIYSQIWLDNCCGHKPLCGLFPFQLASRNNAVGDCCSLHSWKACMCPKFRWNFTTRKLNLQWFVSNIQQVDLGMAEGANKQACSSSKRWCLFCQVILQNFCDKKKSPQEDFMEVEFLSRWSFLSRQPYWFLSYLNSLAWFKSCSSQLISLQITSSYICL